MRDDGIDAIQHVPVGSFGFVDKNQHWRKEQVCMFISPIGINILKEPIEINIFVKNIVVTL